ncbi:MAG: Co2+/Mg2+ efflux protein ApaG [Halothiobacillaceae bacterium]
MNDQPTDTPEQSSDIEVNAVPSYLAEHSSAQDNRYVFAYTITLHNRGLEPARLLERHWIITHADGQTEVVRGPGVVGEQPLLQPGESFTYASGAVIPTPVGTMHGDYLFVRTNGERFSVPIPAFTLSIPRVLH